VTRVLVVAGAASGVGKTSITLGLLAALRRRGLAVQPFKVGPDFIDPGLHALASGRTSYNLDGWLCGRAAVLETVARHAADADLAVVEGVMGCFDGIDATSDTGSTAEVARWLDAPVLLVVDVGGQSRSAAATVLGFERFDPALRLAGVIANRVGSDTHGRWVAEAIRAACRAEPVGAVRGDPALALPERHLGLVTAAEGVLSREHLTRLADAVEGGVDLDRVLAVATPLMTASSVRSTGHATPHVRIAVARDVAFQFYYADNLDRLRDAGAELVFWSPLVDAEPPEADGYYFGGGYPELHARALAQNASCRKAVRRLVERGHPVYAECGGLMYLCDTLEDAGGTVHAMAGVLPAGVSLRSSRLSLAYADVELTADTSLGAKGTSARGQEFHFSTLGPVPDDVRRVYRVTPIHGPVRGEGYVVGRALMSYVHLHFASNPALARGFVEACAEARR
jgi:cobyrinic acid a,c-diamide synthase